jgi:predicted secreted protein
MGRVTPRPSPYVFWRYVAWWAALSLLLELAWESAHVRLYTIWGDPDRWHVTRSVLHCTLGDLVIGGVAYGLAACLLRRVDWPIYRPWWGTGIIIVVTTLYTVWSEWNNVYRLRTWAYASQMPTVLGIGLSPILQWLLLPPLIVLMIRALHRGQSR